MIRLVEGHAPSCPVNSFTPSEALPPSIDRVPRVSVGVQIVRYHAEGNAPTSQEQHSYNPRDYLFQKAQLRRHDTPHSSGHGSEMLRGANLQNQSPFAQDVRLADEGTDQVQVSFAFGPTRCQNRSVQEMVRSTPECLRSRPTVRPLRLRTREGEQNERRPLLGLHFISCVNAEARFQTAPREHAGSVLSLSGIPSRYGRRSPLSGEVRIPQATHSVPAGRVCSASLSSLAF